MAYKFTKYVKFRKSFDGLSVNKSNIYLSNPFMKKFEGTKYMSILFDTDSRAICVKKSKADEDGSYLVTKYGKSKFGGSRIGVKLNDTMPEGRYLYKEDTKDGVVCIMQ